MHQSTSPTSGQLPEDVRNLIDRKLGLLRRDFDQKQIASWARALDRMREEMRQSFIAGSVGKAFISVPLDAYRSLSKEALDLVAAWPDMVVHAMFSILDRAHLAGVVSPVELNAIVDAHAWSMSDPPFLLGVVSPDKFNEVVRAAVRRYQPVPNDYSAPFEHQFDLVAAATSATIRNQGRWVRESAAVAIEERLLGSRMSSAATDTREKNDASGSAAMVPMPVTHANPCADFEQMPKLTADELRIVWVGDKAEDGIGANNMLEVSARGVSKRIPLTTLNLVNMTTGRLNVQGALLLGLAHGKRPPRSDENSKRISRLRDSFRNCFGIADDPFERHEVRGGWIPRFAVSDARGAADERARVAGELRHVPLNSDIDPWHAEDNPTDAGEGNAGNEVDADQWLKRNDPNWHS